MNIAVHLEERGQYSPAYGDPFQEPENEASYAIAPGQEEIVADSFYEYGARRGAGRVLAALSERGLAFTAFAAGRALRDNPGVALALAEQDADVVGQGMRWVSPHETTAADLAPDIDNTVAIAQQMVGTLVRGWCARPPAGPPVREVVARRGLLYDSMSAAHESPYFVTVARRPWLVVPISPDLTDMRFWQNRMFHGRDFASYVIDAVSTVLRESGGPVLLTVHLHPRVVGRPGRIAAVEEIADWLAATPQVSVLRRLAVAEHWLAACAPDDTWNWPG